MEETLTRNNSKRGRGRRPEVAEGPYKYTSIALTDDDLELVREWAWRLRKPKAVLMRELVAKGLAPFRDSLTMQAKYPLPPAAPEPRTLSVEDLEE